MESVPLIGLEPNEPVVYTPEPLQLVNVGDPVVTFIVQFLNSQVLKVTEFTSRSNNTLLNTIFVNIGSCAVSCKYIVRFSKLVFPKVVTLIVSSGGVNLICCCDMPLTVI